MKKKPSKKPIDAKQKKAQEIVNVLKPLFDARIAALEIDEYYAHFYNELRVHKKARQYNEPWAFSEEKIAALEAATEEFRQVYEAELAEAKKMPISWHEARRVLKMFEEDQDSFVPLKDERRES